ncbi:hypothetical protein IGB42_03664 [Andreprevotia sp. IGB-42]|uniref:putative metalloprotease CJM1_0395 family protein n=1 Tax=Andreprevotia sp. IGB-42 TaxID=2497473 RepID=UPI001356E77E|nr:putative metalloprotease CJM1_0395 family protein [Andreprevotia sp. IGB-42]KAF0811854.1 hypothetical protein IGB42_03664 [Andreprevotia sp. IGB-42]
MLSATSSISQQAAASLVPSGRQADSARAQGSGGSADEAGSAETAKASDGTQLDEKSRAALTELQQTDRKVRQHEQAHLSAAGGLATSGASYSFETGPDGKRYAVAGDVHVDVSPGKTAEETLRKARIVQAAALAPADPSGQDRSVAAAAAALEAQANAEISSRTPGQNQLAKSYGSTELPRSSFAVAA